VHWEGQTSGRTDPTIIEHRRRGLELLLFHRKSRREHPGGAFRYEGPFEYVRHEGSGPTRFVLCRDRTLIEQALEMEVENSGAFSPLDVIDARRKIMASIVQRRGQRTFRESLMKAYDGRCAISGCPVPQILEAAHIFPYRGDATNDVTNGLLLRSDLHTLFDCGLIAVDERTSTLLVAAVLAGTEYEKLRGAELRPPTSLPTRPSAEALREHRQAAGL
jgi:putative restriction endonuclease